uniref:Otopetrin 2 n=1 Tax=Neogobius melanostomus TaxID=47308 RepID=A0A8C6WLG1_9GOBI
LLLRFIKGPHEDAPEPYCNSRNWGWMLSGILCLNILILGCALVSGSAHDDIAIKTAHLQIYLSVLLILTTAWMIYYAVYTPRQEGAIVYKDSHAGPVWLRGGLVLFGILSFIMNIFKITSYVGYLHCDSAVKVAFPVVQIVFITVQTYFLWVHAKDCVQVQKNILRCGLMLTLSTNLVMWMALVTEESLHQTTFPKYVSNGTKHHGRSAYISKVAYGDDTCKCSHTSCRILKEAYYYLYPFNIEYSLFASAMAYVMWKNVGRVADEHSHRHFKFRLREAVLGPVAGVLLVVAGIATFIVYEIEMKSDDDLKNSHALMMHFVMNIVIVTLMSLVTALGCGIFKLDHREHVSEKNPTRSLDVGLYFSIVAMVGLGAEGYLNQLNLAWSLTTVIQLGLQNLFIIEGLHREPHHEIHPVEIVANPYLKEKEMSRDVSVGSELPAEIVLHDHHPQHEHKLSWKRRVVKEVCAFLLLGNIILWVMPAFGARPQFDHETEINFYKFNLWATVVNIGLPFGIFYRMHSVASLFEVFLLS